MARTKGHKARGAVNGVQQQGVRSHSPGGGAKSPYILDKLLVPRVVAHGKHNPLTDVDQVAEALRQKYKEYQRRPQAAFRQMVAKAIQATQTQEQSPAIGQVR